MFALMETDLSDIPQVRNIPMQRGKVREMYDLFDCILIVATDHISAYDWILPNGIPDKGKVLNQMSVFWFNWLAERMPWLSTHFITCKWDEIVSRYPSLAPCESQWRGRCMLVNKLHPMFGVEFVVRGYLYGSGLKEYKASQSVCGISLPSGLVKASKLPWPIMTPATKATDGHDINIPYEEIMNRGLATSNEASYMTSASVLIFMQAHEYARSRGITLPDTKFEWGMRHGVITLGDEVLTPDSSRFWPTDKYKEGADQPSLDKQYVRDWLDAFGWDKNSDPPELPSGVVEETRARYLEAHKMLTGKTLEESLAEC